MHHIRMFLPFGSLKKRNTVDLAPTTVMREAYLEAVAGPYRSRIAHHRVGGEMPRLLFPQVNHGERRQSRGRAVRTGISERLGDGQVILMTGNEHDLAVERRPAELGEDAIGVVQRTP